MISHRVWVTDLKKGSWDTPKFGGQEGEGDEQRRWIARGIGKQQESDVSKALWKKCFMEGMSPLSYERGQEYQHVKVDIKVPT